MDFLTTLYRDINIETFEYPSCFLFLILLPIFVFLVIKVPELTFRRVVLPFVVEPEITLDKKRWKTRYRIQIKYINRSLRFLFLIFCSLLFALSYISLTIAICHPYGGTTVETRTEGIDIYFTMDMSASMKAYDYTVGEMQSRTHLNLYTPNRFDTAKATMINFIKSRQERCQDETVSIARCDRIGITMFGQQAFIDVPLTTNYDILREHLEQRQINDIDATQSAIGDGIMSAVASLRHSSAKSRNIILVSDGDRKGGRVSINQAIEAAKRYHVRIFPVMIGAKDTAVLAQMNYNGNVTFHEATFPVNYEVLSEIASQTGGESYRVSSDIDFQQQLGEILERLEPDVSSDVAHENQVDLSLLFVLISFLLALFSYVIYTLLARLYP